MNRGDAWGASFGTAGATTTSAIDRGSRRTPVSNALRPSTIERKSGTVKNKPFVITNWRPSVLRPARNWGTANRSGSTSGSFPVSFLRWSQSTKPHSRTKPPITNQKLSDRLRNCAVASGPSGTRGDTHPQELVCSTPNTTAARPVADSSTPTPSSFGVSAASTSAILVDRASRPKAMNTSAMKTHRQLKLAVTKPPMIGPTAMATADAAAIVPYALARARPVKFPAMSATIVGMMRTAPRPSRRDHPTSSTPTVGAMAVVNEPAA